MATSSRRTASRSAPTSARSTRPPPSGGASGGNSSRGAARASPTPRMDDIPIDPALLAEDDATALQDDLDAEGEVDDGVGYYIPTEAYYYTPSVEPSPTVDAYGIGAVGMHHSDPFLDPNMASSSSRLSLPPTEYDIGSGPASLASPLSAMSTNGNGSVAPVKRKRGRPPKTFDARPNGRGSATPRPRPNGRASSKSAASTLALPNGNTVVREEFCGFCQQPDFRNPSGPKEKLVSCTMCGRSGHPCCLGFTNPAIVNKIMSYPWCCIECKPCEHCKLQGDDNRLLFCDGCDRGWHSYCLKPKLDTPPKGVWYCSKCAVEHNYKPSSSTSAPTSKPTPSRKGKERATATPSLDVSASAPRERKARASTAMSRDATPLNETIPKLKLKAGIMSKDERRPRRPPRETPAPENAPSPTSLVVKLRVPSAPRRDVEIEEEPEEQVPYGGIIEGDDADTSRTSITEADKALFDKSRRAAESRLGGPPAPMWDPQAVSALLSPASSRPATPGPSKSFGKGAGKALSKATPGTPMSSSTTPGMSTPTPSMARPLRDRVLLQQTASMSNVPTAASTSSAVGAGSGRPEKINKIRFGVYDIDTWYQAPYPEEYAQVPDGRLWLCEFCLKYMKSGFVAGRHQMKCKARHPPGDEIYREGNVSVFEVDGRKNKIYCQNLCLLAKMFLDHKTLYYDVEPFLFYVMTEVDDMGARFVGYFSKEKRSPDNNVSCIMTLPVRQRKGWGQLLIDFSYLLSKKEGRVGSPERPLSGLGLLSYKSYWRNTVFQYLRNASGRIRLEDISAATSMTLADIYSVLVDYNMINVHEPTVPQTPTSRPKPRGRGRPSRNPRADADSPQLEGKENKVVVPKRYDIVPDHDVIEAVLQKFEAKGYLKLRPDRLKYTPFLTTRGPAMPRGLPAMTTGGANGDDDDAMGDADADADEAETTSSETKEIISTPVEVEPEDTPDKIAAGQDKATQELVAALSASPVRNLRKRSLNSNASPEHPSKSLRSSVAASPANGRRRRPKSRSVTTTPRRTPRKARSTPRRRKRDPDDDDDEEAEEDDDVFIDADADADADADGDADGDWGDEDAEGEEDEEYYE